MVYYTIRILNSNIYLRNVLCSVTNTPWIPAVVEMVENVISQNVAGYIFYKVVGFIS
jgi:hypothetical protein